MAEHGLYLKTYLAANDLVLACWRLEPNANSCNGQLLIARAVRLIIGFISYLDLIR